MKRAIVFLAMAVFTLSIPAYLDAADFGNALSIATANTPPGADVAGMGNANTALPEFSTNNPAGIAADEKCRFGVSYNFGFTAFKRGPNIITHQTSGTAALSKGMLQLTLYNASSGSAGTAMDVDAKFVYSPSIELMYGLRVGENLLRNGDKLYVGVGGSLSVSKMNFSLTGQNMLISRSRGFQAKGGFLYQPMQNLNFGGMYAYSQDRNDDRELTLNDDGSQSWSTMRSTSDTHQFRLGASWQVLPRLLLAVDYQHLNLGHVKRDQLFAGAELQLIKDYLAVYGGWANSGLTAGIGAYWKQGGVNVAYMNNAFDDMNCHFGRSQTVMGQFFVQF